MQFTNAVKISLILRLSKKYKSGQNFNNDEYRMSCQCQEKIVQTPEQRHHLSSVGRQFQRCVRLSRLVKCNNRLFAKLPYY